MKNKNGEKEVWVNCFCNYIGDEIWKSHTVWVYDGGKFAFNLKINLKTKRFYSFGVNGIA